MELALPVGAAQEPSDDVSLVVAITSSVLELWSPRGTDDFTMATANALACWGLGAWFPAR